MTLNTVLNFYGNTENLTNSSGNSEELKTLLIIVL